MLRLAFRTIRTRWRLFLGTFVALTFGIAVMASMFNTIFSVNQDRPLQGSPTRYDAAAIIVAADQTLRVEQPDSSEQAAKLAEWKRLPVDTADKIAKVPGVQKVITDRSFSATIINKQGASQPQQNQTGHSWSSAQLTPFHLMKGTAPQFDQVVITQAIAQNAHIQPRDSISIATPTGIQSFEVSGIARTAHDDHLPGEDTLFFSDAQAAMLSGQPDKADAIAIMAAPGQNISELQTQLRAALPDKSLQVKTGSDKGGNVAADIYDKSVASVVELVGFNIGLAGFVCVFVVAGTSAFAISQRRQEMALLRLIGATPEQVRRMIVGETAFVASAAIVAGSLFGALFSSALATLLKNYGVAPPEFTSGWTWFGTFLACGIGVVVAFTGVFFASRRAGKVRAAEAMRDAVAEQHVMTRGRWIMGMLFLVISLGLVVLMLLLGGAIAMALAVLITEMLAVALALLMPVFVKPLVSFISTPLVRKTDIEGMLAQANLRNAVRQTTSTAAPILIAVSITISIVGVNATVASSDRRNLEKRTLASYVMSGKVPLKTVEEIRQIPGVASAIAAPASVLYSAGDVSSTPIDYGALDPDALSGNFKVGVQAGSLENLDKNDAVVTILESQDIAWKVGHTMPIYLADGTKTSVRVAAIINTPTALPEVLLSPKLTMDHIRSPMAENVFIRVSDTAGSDTGKVLGALAGKAGANLQSRQMWLSEKAKDSDREGTLAMVIMLGLALAYLSIAIANTLLMAVSSRTKDITLLQQLGVSKRQIVTMIAWETIIVTAIGTLLGILTASLTIIGVWGAISKVIPGTPIPFVRPAYFAAIVGSLLVALLASVLPVKSWLRKGTGLRVE